MKCLLELIFLKGVKVTMSEEIIKKMILEVYVGYHEDIRKPVIKWDYGYKIKCWNLIGILESIKKELLEEVDFQSEQELNGDV